MSVSILSEASRYGFLWTIVFQFLIEARGDSLRFELLPECIYVQPKLIDFLGAFRNVKLKLGIRPLAIGMLVTREGIDWKDETEIVIGEEICLKKEPKA